MKVCEIFNSIQGEGPKTGRPRTFIRLSGCTRACEWCDTKYHTEGQEMDFKSIFERIWYPIVWTGGEPLLQLAQITEFMKESETYLINPLPHELETNGDLLASAGEAILDSFDLIVVSPKDLPHFEWRNWMQSGNVVWKFVTNGGSRTNSQIIDFVENYNIDGCRVWLQPLTLPMSNRLNVKQSIWQLCVNEGWNYSPRCHVDVWGLRKRLV